MRLVVDTLGLRSGKQAEAWLRLRIGKDLSFGKFWLGNPILALASLAAGLIQHEVPPSAPYCHVLVSRLSGLGI